MSPSPMPWWVLPGLGVIAALIFAGAMTASFWLSDTTLRTTLATGALNAMMLAMGYFFGSSAGSAKKDDALAAAAAPPPP